ncbi:MAG: DUF4214 domain-containing protein [Rhizobiaceae bacterium]|nr:DUF4214 domain-containing protein [Rhizobiaceae bacterium]
MAEFVAEQGFAADAWSDDFILFSLLLSSEDTIFDEGFLGEDGRIYDDVYIREAEEGFDQLTLIIAGDFFDIGETTPLGDAAYCAVYVNDDLQFYVADFDADFIDVVDIFDTTNNNGPNTHPLLLELFDGDDSFVLSNGDDWIETGFGDDVIIPAGGENMIFADDGDDTIIAGDGQDLISGGDGIDVVQFEFARDDYDVELFDSELSVRDRFDSSNEDVLKDVERVSFTDGSLLLDLDSDNVSFAYRIYAAAYGRTPDEAGLRFWTDVLDDLGRGPPDAADKEYVAGFFLTADEFTDLYGANPTNEQYIDALYENVLKRLPDQAGYDFWLDVIDSGKGRDDLLIWFTDSNENIANTAPDLDNGIWVA